MRQGWGSSRVHPFSIIAGVMVMLLMSVLFMKLLPGTLVFFLFIPFIFSAVSRQARCEAGKRKHDDFEKRKHHLDTLTTVDGEVFDIIEDRPARRHDDFI